MVHWFLSAREGAFGHPASMMRSRRRQNKTHPQSPFSNPQSLVPNSHSPISIPQSPAPIYRENPFSQPRPMGYNDMTLILILR